jgi:acetylglutamate synthase
MKKYIIALFLSTFCLYSFGIEPIKIAINFEIPNLDLNKRINEKIVLKEKVSTKEQKATSEEQTSSEVCISNFKFTTFCGPYVTYDYVCWISWLAMAAEMIMFEISVCGSLPHYILEVEP